MLDAFEAQVLEVDDATPSEMANGETPAPVEAETETPQETPPQPTSQEKAESLPAQKPTDKPQQADKAQPQAKPTDQGAQTLEQIFPGGVEEARAAHAAAAEMRRGRSGLY